MNTTSEKKVSRKSVKVETTENGHQYFEIFEVRARLVEDGTRCTSDRCLNEEDAEKTAEILRESCADLYECVWVTKQIVWVK